MVWKNTGNSFIFTEGKRSFAAIITPFWSNANKGRRKRAEKRACSSIEGKTALEEKVKLADDVRDKSFSLTHLSSDESEDSEIVIKDFTSTFVSALDSFDSSAATKSVKSRRESTDRSVAHGSASEKSSSLAAVSRDKFSSVKSSFTGSSKSVFTTSSSVKSSKLTGFRSSTPESSLKSSKPKSTLSHSSLKHFGKKRDKREVAIQTDDIAVETPTKFSKNMLKEDPRVEQYQQVLAVFHRLDEFQKKGLLTQQDYEHYHQLLKKYRSDFYVRQINKYLDQIANSELTDIKASIEARKLLDQEVEQDTHSIMAETMSGPSSDMNRKPRPVLIQKGVFPKNGRVSWGDQQLESLTTEFSDDETSFSDKENNTRPGLQENSHTILEPEDLWRGNVNFDEQQLQDLFVEMCFFARLGYAQPPCCLQCTYKETKGQDKMKDQSSTAPPGNPLCRRWVVWRKSADTLLHPNKLDGNILIMQCNVAQKLLDGKVVGGRRWNAEQRRVTTLSVA